LVSLLGRLGLPTLGDVAALPADAVLARFGVEGRRFHALARGFDAGPQVLVVPPPDLVEQAELDPPVTRVDAVAFAAKGLAGRLLFRLAERGLACTRVMIEAETEHGERLARCWRHDHALTPAALAERVRWQLDGWLAAAAELQDPDIEDPTGGLTLLRLVPDEVVPADGRQLGFWGGDQAALDRADRALARVQGMVGYEAVATAVVQGGRTPAEQVRWVPWGDAREPQRPLVVDTFPVAWPGALPSPFPARVFEPPAPAQLRDELGHAVVVSGRGEQSAAPARVECASLPGGGGAVRGWAGPWASDVRWWDPLARRRCARWQVVVDCGTDAGHVACVVTVEAGRAGVEAIYD
jgi:protein ImuB